MKSSRRFAEILTKAVRTIKALEDHDLDIIQDELGYALDKGGGYYIQYLRKGHLPPNMEDVLTLAHELILRKGLTLADCQQFLESAGIPRPKETAERLWAQTENASVTVPVEGKAFVVGPPMMQPRHFFGRERELARIFGWWRASPLMHVTIVGPRRSGKTSLLHYLRVINTTPKSELRKNQRADWLLEPRRYKWVWVDFQDPRMRVRERILEHLLVGCGIEPPKPCTLENFADAMDNHTWESPCIVFMDELGRGLVAPELDQDFWHCLRSLMNATTQGQLGFLLSSHEPPQQVAEERGKTSPFFNMFQTLELGPFSETEARELIASSPMEFPEKDVAWILSQSGRWPILLQILCQERLIALQQGEAGENWQASGLSLITPYNYLLGSGRV